MTTSTNTAIAPRLERAGVRRLLRRQVLVTGASLAAILIAFGVRELWPSGSAPTPPLTPTARTSAPAAPRSPALESEYGIHVNQIGVTAGGGMLDLRYTVLDTDKALLIGGSVDDRARLIVERTGKRLDTAALTMRHRNKIKPGSGTFILFRNDYGAVHRGDLVTLVIGKIELKHLLAL